jgi:hypothetical protein
MAPLVPAWLPAGSKASFDVMRVSTFPGGIACRSPSSAQWLGEESSHFNMFAGLLPEKPAEAAFAQQSFMVPSSKIEK